MTDRSEGSVSRETDPEQVPTSAHVVFGDRLNLARRYAAWLGEAGVERGLLGPREGERLWDRHILNCAVVGELIEVGSALADVGSGAGLPGIPLAIARPDLEIVLLEPMLRRADFLHETVDLLELDTVSVVRSRAEDYMAGTAFDVVTARAVAKIGQLMRWTAPLLRTGGRLMALKGTSVGDELHAGAKELKRSGASSWTVETVGRDVVWPATTVAVVTKG